MAGRAALLLAIVAVVVVVVLFLWWRRRVPSCPEAQRLLKAAGGQLSSGALQAYQKCLAPGMKEKLAVAPGFFFEHDADGIRALKAVFEQVKAKTLALPGSTDAQGRCHDDYYYVFHPACPHRNSVPGSADVLGRPDGLKQFSPASVAYTYYCTSRSPRVAADPATHHCHKLSYPPA